jgi:hypothetical protein
MTVVRTDLIPNLYANPIRTVSKAATAVVTVPVIATVVSTTGTIGTVTGSGTSGTPWTAAISLMSAVTGLQSGDIITATAGTGTFAAGGVVSVKEITGNKSITINKIGGTIPTAGTVTNISEPARTTKPVSMVDGDPILFTLPGNTFTFTSSTGTFQAGELFTQATSAATGLITNVFPLSVEYIATSGVVDTSHVVTGSTTGATTTPTAVTGMNELLTAGENGTNLFYVKELTSTTFELYTDEALTTEVDSQTFTTYTTNAGQYTTTDIVEITVPTP